MFLVHSRWEERWDLFNLFNSQNPIYYLSYLGSGIKIRHDYSKLSYIFLQTSSYLIESFLSFIFSLFSGGRVNPIPRVRPSGLSFKLFRNYSIVIIVVNPYRTCRGKLVFFRGENQIISLVIGNLFFRENNIIIPDGAILSFIKIPMGYFKHYSPIYSIPNML